MRIGFMMPFNKERMEFAVKTGFKCVELQANPGCGYFPMDEGWKPKAAEAKDSFAAMGLRISCIAAFYMNHLNPPDVEFGQKAVRAAVDLAVFMDVPVVAGFSGRVPDKPLEESLPEYKRIWGENAKYAEDHGIKIAFENCPMGPYHQPPNGINMMCTPEMWERAFNEVSSLALGLEWDPSHLICQYIDPVLTLERFGKRVYHVHAKDAHVHKNVLAEYGVWHSAAAEHCMPGFGDTDWGACIKELVRQGYPGDLNIEGWHDNVYRDSDQAKREDEGLKIALGYLSGWVVQD